MKSRFKVGDNVIGGVTGKIVCVHGRDSHGLRYCVDRSDGVAGGGCNGTWVTYQSEIMGLDIKYKRAGRVSLSIY